MSKLNVLVVGASIAGPMTAYWLAKAGANVTVIERFPHLRTSGQNIDIRTTGVTVMRKIPGMEATVRSKVVPMDGISIVSTSGRPYGTIRATGNPDQQSLVSEYEIFRGDLAQILVDLAKDNENIKYIFNEQIASMQQDEANDGPITVEFQNGLPTSQYDLVVACDGATSRTRAIGLGCGVRDHIHPSDTWAAYFSMREDLLKGIKTSQGYSTVGGRFIGVGPDPTGINRVVLMSVHSKKDKDATLPFREAIKQGDDALKRYLAKRYEGMGWKTAEVMQGMLQADDLYANEIVQVKLPTLSKGRFVLVGDAGYATGPTGTGTSIAMTGAYVLAGEICKHRGDLAAGLKGYEETMRPMITDMQKIPPFVSSFLAPQTKWGVRFRNYFFAFIAWTRILEFLQRYLANAFDSGDKYGLPEYDWVA